MRVFITGASGHIGSLVTAELQAAGHQVVGLARSDSSAAALAARNVEVFRGDLDEPDSLRPAAEAADGVIHLAFDHSFTDMAAAAGKDLRAIEVLGGALAGSDRPLVVTSGTAGLAFGRAATEEDPGSPQSPRTASEQLTLDLAGRGVRSSVVRLAPSVHGPADAHGFVPRLVAVAREKGYAGYVGDGSQRWSTVHGLDAAPLYRLALESAPAGSRLHGVGEEGVTLGEIAAAIGRGVGVPTRSVTPEEALADAGFIGAIAAMDVPASSTATQELLGWKPSHPGLLADLEEGFYFA
ncbi:SDR family oxidoreductase [Pseudonocardia ailaonensis]|uniref:SDR family oxidoreductase n=1 Tax=Pseudonocardia ailaonensis TaxID=367279 RepID=A0ABN2MWY5_9PSEU